MGLKWCFTGVDHLSRQQLFILATFLLKKLESEAQESQWYIRSNQAFACCDILKNDSKWFWDLFAICPSNFINPFNTRCPFRWHLNVLKFCLKYPSISNKVSPNLCRFEQVKFICHSKKSTSSH